MESQGVQIVHDHGVGADEHAHGKEQGADDGQKKSGNKARQYGLSQEKANQHAGKHEGKGKHGKKEKSQQTRGVSV